MHNVPFDHVPARFIKFLVYKMKNSQNYNLTTFSNNGPYKIKTEIKT